MIRPYNELPLLSPILFVGDNKEFIPIQTLLEIPEERHEEPRRSTRRSYGNVLSPTHPEILKGTFLL